MDAVAQRIQVVTPEGPLELSSKASLFVNLEDPEARGIHMSRLYLVLGQFQQTPLTPQRLQTLIQEMLDSHEQLSSAAMLKFAFEMPILRPALISDHVGWRLYPAEIQATYINGKLELELQLQIAYSSSCPCSAALARQVIQDNFSERFGHQDRLNPDAVHEWLGTQAGISAVPHSQRSHADVRVKLDPAKSDHFPIVALVELLEDALKTPVQTAVKREDEQEFARLNGQNAMFCEDAARYLKARLNAESALLDFYIRVRHMESLHAHDAIAVATKNVAGGYTPLLS